MRKVIIVLKPTQSANFRSILKPAPNSLPNNPYEKNNF